MDASLFTFLTVIVLLAITPGADMALVMRSVLSDGFRAIWPTLAGIVSALSIHVTVCIAGLGAILANSDSAFTAVKLAGTAWLLFMGAQALAEAWRQRQAVQTPGDPTPATAGGRRPRARTLYARGFVTNLLNVKIALFYLAFLPQFAPAGDRFVPVAIALAAAQAAVGLSWLVCYGALCAAAGRALAGSPRMRRWLETATGVALIGFGVRLAAAAR